MLDDFDDGRARMEERISRQRELGLTRDKEHYLLRATVEVAGGVRAAGSAVGVHGVFLQFIFGGPVQFIPVTRYCPD